MRRHFILPAWLVLLVLAIQVGCGETRSSRDPEAAPAIKLPSPALNGLEGQARQQIETRQEALARSLDRDEVETLGPQFGEMGRLYFAYDFLEATTSCLEIATHLSPGDFRWHYLLGAALQTTGDYDAASASLDRARAMRPDDLPSLLRSAQVALADNRLAEAQGLYERASTLRPSTAAAHAGLGRIAAMREQPSEALESYERALELQPEAVGLHYSLGIAYRDVGDLDSARSHLERSGQRQPTFSDSLIEELAELRAGARVHWAQGNAAKRSGQLEEALALYRKAVEIEPDYAPAHHNLGALLGVLGSHEQARQHLERAVELSPDYRDARFDLATALSRTGRSEPAVEEFSRVLELDPTDREARLRRAIVLGSLDRREEARQDLEQVVLDDPQDLKAALQLASLVFEMGRFQESAVLFSEIARLTPHDSEAHLGAARSFLSVGRYRTGRDILEKLILDEPDLLSAKVLLARLLATCSEPEIRDGQRALELARSAFETRRELVLGETVAMALAETGRYQEALAWQTRLLAEAERSGAPAETLERLRTELESYRVGRPIRGAE